MESLLRAHRTGESSERPGAGHLEGQKIGSFFVVDQNTLIAAKDAVLWKLSVVIWAELWDVLYHLRQGHGPETWTFTLMRGADVQTFVITNAETVRPGASAPPRAEQLPCSAADTAVTPAEHQEKFLNKLIRAASARAHRI